MILLLAGLAGDAEGSSGGGRVDGATPWQSFWKITFPLMLPVSHGGHPADHLQAEDRRHHST